ncbi:MAG TPA: HhoA/HhoB/HtrA family serine endopeptidase [Coleofasciculaceae cyanobacterium]|jgi:Do/DeqQ family serine protease
MKKTSYSNTLNYFDLTSLNLIKKPSQTLNKIGLDSNRTVLQFFGRKSKIYLLLPLIGIGIMLLEGCSEAGNISPSQQTTPQALDNSRDRSNSPNENLSNRPLAPTTSDSNFVVEVVKKVEPAVVQINTSQTVRRQAPEGFDDPLFRRFFGDAQPSQPSGRSVRGLGSGFVISANGQILTNSHVVNKADRVTVSFSDGRTLEGKVVGEDPASDIAVVQVQANNLPTVALGSSEQVQPGQWAIAIGNPLGLQETVTVGVVSATSRSGSDIGASDKRIDFIQTDAAINPGNSGGPLLNARGEVIGINTAIIQGAQGLGFAIPIDTARRIAQQLITKGRVDHPYLGVQMANITPEIKEKLSNRGLRVDADRGVLIVRVVSGSPANKAGMKPGDVIQAINNQPVNKAGELQQLMEKSGVGNPLQVQLLRNGQKLSLAVRPEPLPAQSEG